MPRKSAAELTTLRPAAPVALLPRLAVPAGLTDPQRAIWVRMVAAAPAGRFNGLDVPLLTELVRAIDRADEIERLRRQIDPDDAAALLPLLRAAEAAGKAVAVLATRLRLTPQARYQPDDKRLTDPRPGDPIDALMRLDDD